LRSTAYAKHSAVQNLHESKEALKATLDRKSVKETRNRKTNRPQKGDTENTF